MLCFWQYDTVSLCIETKVYIKGRYAGGCKTNNKTTKTNITISLLFPSKSVQMDCILQTAVFHVAVVATTTGVMLPVEIALGVLKNMKERDVQISKASFYFA